MRISIFKYLPSQGYLGITSKIIFWILTFLFVTPAFLFAQNYPAKNYTMLDGLPSMTIRCLYKDSNGLMWIGTDAGLCTFDGKSFRIFKQSEGMTASQIWAIAEDNLGNMWFGSYGDGLFKYDGTSFKKFTKEDGISDNFIRTLCFSSTSKSIIAGSKEGVSIIRKDSIHSNPEDSEFIGTVTGMADAGEFVYITTYSRKNPLRYYPKENKLISVADGGKHYPGNSFSCFISSKGDTLLSYENKGIKIYSPHGEILNDSIGQIFGIAEDIRGDIWMASWAYPTMYTKGGIYKYDGKSFKNYREAFGITDDEIWTVFYDKQQDILWIGTINEGLFMVPFSGITNYPLSYFKAESQKTNNVSVDSKGNIWISGNRDLITFGKDGEFSKINKPLMAQAFRQFWNIRNPNEYSYPGKTRQEILTSSEGALAQLVEKSDFHFHNVLEDSDSTILISNELGLFHYNIQNQKIQYFGIEGSLAEIMVINDTLVINQEWTHTVFHVNYTENKDNFDRSKEFNPDIFKRFNENGQPLNVNSIKKHDDKLWYATRTSGLWMSDGIRLINLQADSAINNNLNDICFDNQGHVISGSNNGEVSIASYSDNELKIKHRINNENGLKGNSISWLTIDEKNNLWVGTNQALNRINLNELYTNGNYQIKYIDGEEGFSGQSSKSAVLDKDGNLWIGASNQLIKVNTDSFLDTTISTFGRIDLTGLDVNNMPLKHISKHSIINDFKYNENNLTFHFDIINYLNPDKDKFRYKLNGFDKTWSKWNDNRKAAYTNLPSGEYTFIVESYNAYSLAEAEPLKFDFTIRHPWWGIWYVNLIILILLFVSSILLTKKWITKKREKEIQKAELEKKIVQLEMKALQAQMNPHFIFNSINGIQSFILADKMDEVLEYLGDFSKVVRGSLENANKSMVPLEQEIEFLTSYLHLEQMRFSNKFDFEIKTQKIKFLNSSLIPPMIVQPFAENAVKHGFMNLITKGFLSIVFEGVEKDVIKCTITDNGIGREKSQKTNNSVTENDRLHSGRITEDRIQLFNSLNEPDKYKVVYTELKNNNEVCGLKVELYLPMNKY